jgi:MFS family permease
VRIGFTLFGIFWGVWSVAATDIERALRLSHGAFGLLYAAALAVAGLANVIGGPLAERHPPVRVFAVALLGWAAAIAFGALARGTAPLALAVIAIVSFGGLVDVGLNVIATPAFDDDPGGLVRFHARFNAGGAIGAVAIGLALGHAISWRWAWATIAALALLLAAASWREDGARPIAHPHGDRPRLLGALSLLRAEGLVPVAIAFTVGTMIEGGVELWGVLYLRTQLHSGILVASVSAVLAFTVATVARVVVGPRAGSRGAVTGVALGGGAATVGFLVLASTHNAVVSGLGLVIAAGGASLNWPLLLSHASAGRDRPAPIVGSITAMGYLGLVIGPAIVGWIAQAVGLRWGLLFLAGGAALVAVLPAWSGRRGAEAR